MATLIYPDALKKTVTASDVEAAVTRAIQSAEWATESNDALALAYLRNFMKSSHMQTMFQAHLSSLQPNLRNLENLPLAVLQLLYSRAHQGGPVESVRFASFSNISSKGSALYELRRVGTTPVLLYVRELRGALRGELNETNFGILPSVPGVTRHEPQQKGVFSLIKKVWKEII
jgi:hypothetical protein